MVREPLSKAAVVNTIERKGGGPVPLVLHKWWGNGLREKYGAALDRVAANYPDDIFLSHPVAPAMTVSGTANPNYRWGHRSDYRGAESHSIGENVVLLPEWDELDWFLADFPNPREPGSFDKVRASLPAAGGRYKLGMWWHLFHERLWMIRGMENLMVDYFEEMERLKILGRRILEFNKAMVDQFAELGFDAFFSSDDLGHQAGLMMSPEVFQELYYPLYEELAAHIHGQGMHFFLHSCGDNTALMDELIRAGVDVFHPVQKGCMDERATAARFGERISFLAGVDVQHLLPEGTVAEVRAGVRAGVRELIDHMARPDGGLLLAAGNGIMPDTPLENIDAMLDEMALYRAVRR
ncbi:MAG: hypothetical protein LBK60_11150 [Verrucomicrobiales bacterium]|jgi:uroporphyrinogen decarboxylase|nr:hypothetical protein [Verrucomicrobiales bacterium]